MRHILTTTAFALALCGSANAQSKGDWTIGLGVGVVSPKHHATKTSAGKIKVKSNTRPTLTGEYFVWDNVGVELLAAWPFKHTIRLKGAGKIGTTKHLPPTLTLHYYFTNSTPVTPFIGAGLNYTTFFHERTEGALEHSKLKLKDSFGYALHGGIQYDFNDRFALRADVRYIDIRTKTKVDGRKIGKVKINPFVFGSSAILKF